MENLQLVSGSFWVASHIPIGHVPKCELRLKAKIAGDGLADEAEGKGLLIDPLVSVEEEEDSNVEEEEEEPLKESEG